MTRDPTDQPPAMADDALLAPFRERDDPVLTTDEVADAVPSRRRATREGLERLFEEGVVERKPVGDETVWWLPGHTETDATHEPMPGAASDVEGGLPNSLETEIQALDAPDEPERRAIYAACYHLCEHGATDPETLRSEVYPEHEGGYDDPEDWWNVCVRPAFTTLSGVTRTDDGRWRIG